jgi:hypothetical protein
MLAAVVGVSAPGFAAGPLQTAPTRPTLFVVVFGQRVGLGAFTLVWCTLVVAGLRDLYTYTTTEGGSRAEPARWPAGSTLPHAEEGVTVVMFVHPDCVCSKASLAELATIAASDHTGAMFVIAVVSDDPSGPRWEAAGQVSGARRILDRGGIEAKRFGARTSGQVVVYRRGALEFAGGITGSRGHAGDNIGRQSVMQVLAGAPPRDHRHGVFGCGLAELR